MRVNKKLVDKEKTIGECPIKSGMKGVIILLTAVMPPSNQSEKFTRHTIILCFFFNVCFCAKFIYPHTAQVGTNKKKKREKTASTHLVDGGIKRMTVTALAM